ncbi:branched-chain amino acid ABC transporter permease [Thermus oshimai]|uniref:branched-chain amino acid ABC transporter permease n=1 Tax=Thermus oshimai TaxID=56957 RepID=UPI00037A842E|nr:branched-chain amino acid ABC transporter permease [Thermus oshimai]
MKGGFWPFLLPLALVPPALGGYPLYLATDVAVWALAATGQALLYRFTGLVSLGHAAFLGGGAYVGALLTRGQPEFFPLALLLAPVLGSAVALFLGALSLRSHGIFFLMLSLALAQLLYVLAKQGFPQITGGDDGLSGVPKPPFLESPGAYYLLALALLLGVLWAYHRFAQSPLGRTLEALRSNEARLEALGYPVRGYKLLAFGLSGALTALAGVLLAAHRGFVHPHDLAWHTSGALLVMAVIGGMTWTHGGLLGAAILILAEALLSTWTGLWNLFLGAVLMGVVLLPRLRRLASRRWTYGRA